MAQLERQTAPVVCPVSPGGSAHLSDHHSDLTGSTAEDDENFIALLQYKDAYHILSLDPRTSVISPTTIKDAYDVAKQQTLNALEQCEATEKQASGRNTFFASQQNYLELKLQALDQAYEELMHDTIVAADGRDGHIANVVESHEEAAAPAEAPSPAQPNEFVPIEGDSAKGPTARMKGSGDSTQNNSQPSEDELDTIDIYFRPSSPTKSQSSRAKSPEHPSDASHCTWDGSSIFSMLSKTQQSIEEASGAGLSDVLGLYNSSPGRSMSSAAREKQLADSTTAAASQDEEKPGPSSKHRPPTGIQVKHLSKRTSPKAQISPTSVSDLHNASIHDQNHYDNSSNFNKGKKLVGRGRMMKSSRQAASTHHHNSHEATEAARMGILRALSEDNSVCLPLDDDEDHAYLNVSYDTAGMSEHAKFMTRHPVRDAHGQESKPRLFQGKSDAMPKDSNSLMASVLEKQSQTASVDPSTLADREEASEERDESNKGSAAPRSQPSTETPRSRQRKTKPARQARSKYEGSLQVEDNSYDGILQTGMDFADELCVALNSCWKGDLEFPKTLARAGSAAYDAAASEFDRSAVKDEESTIYTRDDSTYQSQSVSTGFNTQSSFRRRDDAPKMKKKKVPRSYTSSPTTTVSSSDPPPRMLV